MQLAQDHIAGLVVGQEQNSGSLLLTLVYLLDYIVYFHRKMLIFCLLLWYSELLYQMYSLK